MCTDNAQRGLEWLDLEKGGINKRGLSLGCEHRSVHLNRAESPVHQVSRIFFLKGMYSLMVGYELHFLWGEGQHNL